MKTAVVTGSGRGIGKAIMDALYDAGWKVVGLSLENGFDVRSYNLMCHAFYGIGKVDLLVNNAGVGHCVPFENMTIEQWNETIDTNLTGIFNCTKAALPYLKDGDIINIASRSGVYAHANLAAYCASKAGVMMLSEALGLDLRGYGIRVGYIMPGIVATTFVGQKPKEWHIQPQDIAQTVLAMVSLPRNANFGRVEVRPTFPQ